MSMQQGWQVMRSMSRDSSVKEQTLAEGTTKRVMSYARPYRGRIAAFLVLVVIDAVLVVATPLILKSLVDDGVVPGDRQVVVRLAVLVAGLALLTAIVALAERWLSSRIGEGLIYDLRTQVFGHVLRQPIAFFTRAQTGALVSRLGQDVIGAQQAFTSVLSNTVSNAISLVLILVAMASLSWQLTLGAVLLVPLFLVPAKLMGRRLADLSHQQMGLNADLSSRMTERFNVAGALLVKLFGRPATEDEEYAARAAGVRDIGVRIAINRAVFFVALTTVASLATAMVYGFDKYDETSLRESIAAIDNPMGRSPLVYAMNKATEDLKNMTGRIGVIILTDGWRMEEKSIEAAENMKNELGDKHRYYEYFKKATHMNGVMACMPYDIYLN